MDELDALYDLAKSLDIHAMRIIPDGADKPLPLTPYDEAEITPADVRRAIRKWNELMPEYAGILEAKIAPPKKAKRK